MANRGSCSQSINPSLHHHQLSTSASVPAFLNHQSSLRLPSPAIRGQLAARFHSIYSRKVSRLPTPTGVFSGYVPKARQLQVAPPSPPISQPTNQPVEEQRRTKVCFNLPETVPPEKCSRIEKPTCSGDITVHVSDDIVVKAKKYNVVSINIGW